MPTKRYYVPIALALVLSGPFGIVTAQPRPGDPDFPVLEEPHSNSVSNLVVNPGQEDGEWTVDFEYTFTGDPSTAAFRIDVVPEAGTDPKTFNGSLTRMTYAPNAGRHHMNWRIVDPGEGRSGQVVVSIIAAWPDGRVLASQRVDKVIQWLSQDEKDFNIAYAMIENTSRDALRQARATLERLIAKNPQFDPGYVELARVVMKTNWGPEGLHQAETLLDSALAIRPDSVNAKILLGYVFVQQDRLQEAETLFAEAARLPPPTPVNIWLWINRGELLEMQGRPDEAMAQYREALAHPRTPIRDFRARLDAYARLLRLLEERHDPDGMEALYRARIGEYGPSSCYSDEYARFKLHVRHDAQGAIDLARGALNGGCVDKESRQILGLASYMKWAESDGTESAGALNQARVFLPAGPMALYLLASDDSTMSAASKLIKTGEAIDQKDNDAMTALALALQKDEPDAAERLLRLGARTDTLVGEEAMPVALLPVLNSNVAGIRVMQRAGVDYSKLRYRGITALDFAKQIGDDDLIKALRAKESRL